MQTNPTPYTIVNNYLYLVRIEPLHKGRVALIPHDAPISYDDFLARIYSPRKEDFMKKFFEVEVKKSRSVSPILAFKNYGC